MKKNYIVFVILLLSQLIHAQPPTPRWSWAKRMAGVNDDFSQFVCTDGKRNIYVAGDFESPNITMDSITLPNSFSGKRDIFIVKYDPSGKAIWATRAGDTLNDVLRSMHVAANGDLFITGSFESSTITFGGVTLTNTGGNDVFVVKYDSNGNVLWAKSFGGTGSDKGVNISTDNSGNILLTGIFTSPSISFDNTTLLNLETGYCDIFIVKYDAFGNVIWAQKAGGTTYDFGESITADPSGNIFVTGYFSSSSITFGSIVLTNSNGSGTMSDCFTVKYDPTGNVLWARVAGVSAGSDQGHCIKSDKEGNLILAGTFGSTSITFGSTTLKNVGTGNDIFLVKYDPSGNVSWAVQAGGAKDEEVLSLSLDKEGNIYETGTFFSSYMHVDKIFVPNSGTADIFVARYDTAGKSVWATHTASGASTYGYGVTVDDEGVIYVTGNFKNGVVLGSTPLGGLGGVDGFMAKICNLPFAIVASGPTTICSGGNVTLDAGAGYASYLWSNGSTSQTINVSKPGTYTATVTNAVGCSATADKKVDTVTAPSSVSLPTTQYYCDKTNTPVLKFSSVPAGATFNWINSDPSIGLPLSGTGDISSFVAMNTSTAIVNALIKVTTTFNGCNFYGGLFGITVYPSLNIKYSDSVYCQIDTNPMPEITGQPGNFTSIPYGVVFKNPQTGEIDLLASTPGKYKIQYAASIACRDTIYAPITILEVAKINAGIDAVMCAGDSLQLLSSKGGATTSVLWKTSGTGKFNDATLVSPKYSPSSADIALGKVILTVSTNTPVRCGAAAHDTIVVTIIKCKHPIGESTFFKSCNVDSAVNAMTSVIQTADGGYVFSGHLPGNNNVPDAYCLIKTGKYGNTLWTRKYINQNLSYADQNYIVRQTIDGGYISASALALKNDGGYIVVIRTDSTGRILWSKKYGTKSILEFRSLVITADQGYAIIGNSDDFTTAGKNAFLLKINKTGAVQWSKSYGGTDSEIANAVQETPDKGFVFVGMTRSPSGGNPTISLYKTDSLGKLIWTKLFHGSSPNTVHVGNNVIVTNEGGYLIIGDIYPSNAFFSYLIKTDAEGNEQWAKFYGKNGDYYKGLDITQTLDGGYAFSGYSKIKNEYHPYLVKMNGQGVKIFEKDYGDSLASTNLSGNHYNSLKQAADGGFIFCSTAMHAGTANKCFLVKTDSLGNSGCLVKNGTADFTSIKSSITSITPKTTSLTATENNIVFDEYEGIEPFTFCNEATYVWPGDTDADAIADNYDLLSVGVYHGQKGAARSTISNAWQAYKTIDWSTKQNNGYDIKHVDCNGDGTINADDTMAIHLNFNLKHLAPLYYQYKKQPGAPDLFFVSSSKNYKSGDIVDIEVWLGTSTVPVDRLYGVAFNINYNSSLVENLTERLSYPFSWIGTNNTNVLNMAKIAPSLNTVYCAKTRIDHTHANGYGKIAELKFQLKNGIVNNTKMIFSISSYIANDSAGAPVTLNPIADTIIINSTIGINEHSNELVTSIFPNPFTLQTKILFNMDLEKATIKVIDLLGKEVRSISFSGNELILEKGDLKAGIYFLQVIPASGIGSNQKIMIN